MRSRWSVLLLGLWAAGCDSSGQPARQLSAQVTSRTVVDSALPIEEEILRFRATIPEVPDSLGAGSTGSRDDLVRAFVEAIANADTAKVRSQLITRAEFAYLYYPHTRYTRRPYQLAPSVLWFITVQNSKKGIDRAFRQYGGKPISLVDYTCGPEPDVQGPNRLWTACLVRIRSPEGESRHRMFGGILEAGGRLKFVTLANEF